MGDSQAINNELVWSEWMERALQGDEESYRQLLSALGKVIENYLRKRFGSLEFLEDMVQESLMAIHQARHTYIAGRPFSPWMFSIVRYKAIDMLRKRDGRQRLNNLLRTEQVEPGEKATGAEALLEGEQLFEGLKAKSRQALILTKVIGLSIREAADKLGVSEVAMKVRVHRALQELRIQLKQQ